MLLNILERKVFGRNKAEWEVEVNGIPYFKCKDRLDTILKDNDRVTIRIMALGGGYGIFHFG